MGRSQLVRSKRRALQDSFIHGCLDGPPIHGSWRTYVITRAVRLLHSGLDLPEHGGLDVAVRSSEDGCQLEGLSRLNEVVPGADMRGKAHNGCEKSPYAEQKDRGQDTAYLSLCWDDWLDGKREVVNVYFSLDS
ncbi:hypothetical protein N7533_007162 [Penicillium manginii]|uniref:uncharacterized protein n=1 Tax=Penicillium manginii TaxID=203109 RepID=UPI002548F125|nr:uncharacterized protein N7533_007162 [Penicillium manginii]KAJ5750134.1 hypothetical protein N7533_007162 [Penicillium manginii]